MMCDDITLSLGSYLLGSLDAAETVAVEAHLADCEHCRSELADLAALPSLLERLTLDDFALEPPQVSDDLFDRVAARAREEQERSDSAVSQRHRYRRLTAVAAAVVVIAGSSVGAVAVAEHHGRPSPKVVVWAGHSGAISMQVALAAQTSGTKLQVKVSGLPTDEHCQLVAVTKDGSRRVVGQWYATYSGVAQVTGSTSIARSDLSQLLLLGTHGEHLVTARV